jgi:hypothetical protein
MSYEDIVEAQRERDVKYASRIRQCKDSASVQGQQVNSRSVELRKKGRGRNQVTWIGEVLFDFIFDQLVLIELYCFKCFDS